MVALPYNVRYIVTMDIDYRDLLKRYINHVGESEGTTFLVWNEPRGFTDEEWAELQALDREGMRDLKEQRS